MLEGGAVKLLSTIDFFAEAMEERPNKMDMSAYQGDPFQCACEKSHLFHSNQIQVLRELTNMRLVFECPDQPIFVTCVKVKGIFRFKGFESLFGYKAERSSDLLSWVRGGKTRKSVPEGEKIKGMWGE